MKTQTKPAQRIVTSVTWAAQADVMLLTVEMIRPPLIVAHHPDAGAPPHPEWTRWRAEELRSLLAAAGWSPRSKAGRALGAALQEVLAVSRTTSMSEWSDEYWRLFESSIACPINEASYIRRDKGAILGDIAGFYAAFGWRPDPQRGERPDHLRCELEFVALLLAMAAGADSNEQATTVQAALAEFIRQHLHDWLPSFAWQLCESSRLAYFGAVSNWIVQWWTHWSIYHGWPVDERPAEPLSPLEETENPYECAANGLVQIGEH